MKRTYLGWSMWRWARSAAEIFAGGIFGFELMMFFCSRCPAFLRVMLRIAELTSLVLIGALALIVVVYMAALFERGYEDLCGSTHCIWRRNDGDSGHAGAVRGGRGDPPDRNDQHLGRDI